MAARASLLLLRSEYGVACPLDFGEIRAVPIAVCSARGSSNPRLPLTSLKYAYFVPQHTCNFSSACYIIGSIPTVRMSST
ncbi:hypothetical protein BKA67DRAFT_566336 [Truncatella angustata]|uniref:Uncharacterized protein n=1 Tax=Truncatella angustata TaxID=152316 RepID=A0A9P8UMT4_9PEZI|nr:uncharacterized protein BKA67DRAFT_566336 [Truncatella angustata]KAH6654847.1 hypothetical protein BKA67DRAFT_566336 [Truncatella angustata]